MTFPEWIKPTLWGVACGAVAMAAVGFWELGWTTASSADRLASDRASSAVVSALVPFCVSKAEHDPDKAVLAKVLAEQSSYTRSDLVLKAGWATFGSKESSPNDALATACSDKLRTATAG
jgi:hypothetical protein